MAKKPGVEWTWRLPRHCRTVVLPGKSANPESRDQDRSSRRTLPRLHCCEEGTAADTPRYSQYQNDPESSDPHLEDADVPTCPPLVAQPDRQCQKASTPLACASRPTKEQPRVQPQCVLFFSHKRSPNQCLSFSLS